MRYFWHAITAIGFLAVIVFLFFVFSLSNKNRITFTDDLPELTEPTVTIADPILGTADAKATIVNFGDYQCEGCNDLEVILTDIMDEYGDDVRLVWKDMPNTTSHPEALNAAIAARCAEKQDKFFEYHAYIFANRNNLDAALYTEIAVQLGLKERAFTNCFENQDTLPLVQKSYDEGLALNVAATPTLFINGERFVGDISKSEIENAVRAAINGL